MKIHRTLPLESSQAIAEGVVELPLDQLNSTVPGTVVGCRKGLWVMTGDGVLALDLIQPSGKKVQKAADVSHNYEAGTRFTNDDSESGEINN